MRESLPSYEKCFFCGPATGGLALDLQYADKRAFTEFAAHEKFQGYDGMLHGGIVAGILDEVMWWTLFVETRMLCATRKIEVEFLKPIICGRTYRASGELIRSVRHIHHLAGIIEDGNGGPCARAKGTFLRTKGFSLKDLARYLDFRGVSPEMRALFNHTEPGTGQSSS
jgi:uncharacterized protein (TIGR00369 family)